MNKKGFTVIELLAVMAILSLIIVLLISGVSGAKTRAMEKAQNIEKKSIMDAGVSFFESMKSDSVFENVGTRKECKVQIKTLRDEKF